MANALGYPAAPIGWSDVFRLATNPAGWASVAGGTASWGAFKLAKTLPTVSTSGLNALIATYYASGVPMTGNGVEQSPVARRFVGAIELSVVHYGLTVREFTVNLQRVDETGSPTSYVSAIALEEQELVQYDHSARTPLVPVYPTDGTLVEDHPFVVLATSRPKIDGAHDFYRWVEQTQQAAIDQNGFRLAGIAGHKTPLPGGVLEANLKLDGVNPARSFPSIAAPPGDVIRAMVREWAQLRRPARVQILIDTATSAPLESTLCRIQKALAALQPQDQVGIATFPATDGSGYLQVLPIATVGTAPAIGKPPCGPAPPALVQALAVVKPAPDATGSTLDAALGEAVSMLNSSYEPQSINAVLLVELASPNLAPSALNALAQKLIDQSAPTAHDGQGGVRVFAIGPTADASLARITTSGQGAIYPADAPPSLLNGVISGF